MGELQYETYREVAFPFLAAVCSRKAVLFGHLNIIEAINAFTTNARNPTTLQNCCIQLTYAIKSISYA